MRRALAAISFLALGLAAGLSPARAALLTLDDDHHDRGGTRFARAGPTWGHDRFHRDAPGFAALVRWRAPWESDGAHGPVAFGWERPPGRGAGGWHAEGHDHPSPWRPFEPGNAVVHWFFQIAAFPAPWHRPGRGHWVVHGWFFAHVHFTPAHGHLPPDPDVPHVPIPAAVWLLGSGLAALGLVGARRRRNAA